MFQGVARPKARLIEKVFWFQMSKDVESYVLSCNVCNQNKAYGKVPYTEFQAGIPMERVHIDFIGPLPKTKLRNVHCLMMVDQFGKWVECVPLPTQRAEETAQADFFHVSVYHYRFSPIKAGTLTENYFKLYVKLRRSIRLEPLLIDLQQTDM